MIRSLLLLMAIYFSASMMAQETKELSFTPQLLMVDNNEVCAIGDINRDGLNDIVAGRLWYAAPDFVPRPLRPLTLHPPEYASNNGEYLWDFNGDGWLDLVTSGWGDSQLRWFENPGKEYLEKGLEWEEHLLVDTKILRSEVGLFEDLNGDETPEFILNSWHEPNPFLIWLLDQDSEGNPIARQKQVGPRNGHGVGIGDINHDGLLDILFDEGWYQQPKDIEAVWTWHQDWQFDDSSCPVIVQDLNQDGRNDIIWGRGHNYGLYWMEQGPVIRDSTTWKKHVIDESWSQIHAMTWADLDGDGVGELITGKRIWAHTGKDPGANEPAVIYRYVWDPKQQRFSRHEINIGVASTGLFIRVNDLNADQKPDVVVAGKTGTFILWQD
jgi:hypothetical protein